MQMPDFEYRFLSDVLMVVPGKMPGKRYMPLTSYLVEKISHHTELITTNVV